MAGVTYSMQQGYLEGSNVDAARTMTDMLTAYRAFEANQKILQAYDRSMEKAVTEVGRSTNDTHLKGVGMHDTHNDDSNEYDESIAKSN